VSNCCLTPNGQVVSYISILIIGDVETHPGAGRYNSNPPVNITNNNVDKYISICNINIRSVRNKLYYRLPGNPSLLHDLIVSSIHCPSIQVDKCHLSSVNQVVTLYHYLTYNVLR
jgi:hypothetical protein